LKRKNVIFGFLAIVVLFAFGAGGKPCSGAQERPGAVRAWVDRDGRVIQAYLREATGADVILVKDGKEYRFPVSRLSEADRAYVTDWMESRLPKQVETAGGKSFPQLSDKELETAPYLSLELVEKTVFDFTNQERKTNGVKALQKYEELSSVARVHSKDMCLRGFFSHQNPDGDGPTERARKAEFPGLAKSPDGKPRPGLSENIARVGRYSSIRQSTREEKIVRRRIGWQSEVMLARQIVRGLLDSPEHKKNMLDPTKAYQGVGIYVFREHVFVTQNFF